LILVKAVLYQKKKEAWLGASFLFKTLLPRHETAWQNQNTYEGELMGQIMYFAVLSSI
jgi:hypothetical protein